MRSATCALLGLVLSAGLAVSACDIKTGGDGGFNIGISRGSAEDTWTRSYPVTAGGRLELINVNGRVDAEPSSGTSIEVEARRTAKGSSDEAAKEQLGKIEMREEVGDNRVRIEVRPPRMSGFSGHEVKWTIKVPKGVQVDLRTTNGGVHLTGLDAAIHAETTNGGVEGKDLTATSVEASAVNGGIDIGLNAPLGADGQGRPRDGQRRRRTSPAPRQQGDHQRPRHQRRRARDGPRRAEDGRRRRPPSSHRHPERRRRAGVAADHQRRRAHFVVSQDEADDLGREPGDGRRETGVGITRATLTSEFGSRFPVPGSRPP